MVSEKFVNNLKKRIQKKLKKVIAGEPTIGTLGSDIDQYKGLLHELKMSVNPFSNSEVLQAKEILTAKIPVNDSHLDSFFFATTVLNQKGKSVQGIGTFVAHVPFSIPENYMALPIFASLAQLPDVLKLNDPNRPKEKGAYKVCKAVEALNKDRKMNLFTSKNYEVQGAGFSSKTYTVAFEPLHPPGRFSIVPYKGHSIMIRREAGAWGATENSPSYDFKGAYMALSRCAEHIHNFPETGVNIGEFPFDQTLMLILAPLLHGISQSSG